MSSEDILIDISRVSTRATVSKYFQQNVCGVKRERRTLYYRRRQPNIYVHQGEMDGCLVDCIAAHGARAVLVFHGNDYEHWQTGKCFHTHTHSHLLLDSPSFSTLHPLLPLILFDRGFPFFLFLFNKGHNKPKRTRQMLILVAILQKTLIDGQQIP